MPPESFSDVAIPGITVSGRWPEAWTKEGATLRALESLREEPFFHAAHIFEVPFAAERKAIAHFLRSSGLSITYCLTGGDFHPPFGAPGEVGAETIGAVLAQAIRDGLLARGPRRRIFGEMLRRTETPAQAIAHVRAMLETGWAIARNHLG